MNQSTSCRCHHLFNAETYYSEHKTALGDLYRFDDVLLAGGKDRVGVSNLSAYVLLIPLYGAVECRVGSSEPGLVAAGQIQVFSIRENESYRLHNPFSDIVVNYLELFLTKRWIQRTRSPHPLMQI